MMDMAIYIFNENSVEKTSTKSILIQGLPGTCLCCHVLEFKVRLQWPFSIAIEIMTHHTFFLKHTIYTVVDPVIYIERKSVFTSSPAMCMPIKVKV